MENLILENILYKLYKSIFNDNHFIVRKSDNETMETFTDNNKAVDCFKENYRVVNAFKDNHLTLYAWCECGSKLVDHHTAPYFKCQCCGAKYKINEIIDEINR